ncbi:hypothetical protein SCLCIDRAFT_1219543 [Scleroderma citrinum Foug A]|uniref:Btz domain-containing protein n=1 Tax=Scleroderma citrinum Foug A TaxID=1036808 RepID=A0A0C3D9C2_9AGAM|nr:hypothetical protein SCLCIDRAFT_1219543 [Scleroderma citrinum Foug A]
MPATTTTPSSLPGSSPSKSRPQPRLKKIRPVRRRGRGRHDFESDEEIVREVGTDSELDNDDHSSVGSTTDSDTEPVSEDVSSNGRQSRILTPNTTQSSADVRSLRHTGPRASTKPKNQDPPSFFEGGNWSEMVADEAANGPSDLPVVDFADFGTSSLDQPAVKAPPPRKAPKSSRRPQVKRAVSAPTVDRPPAPQPSPPAQTDLDMEDPTDGQQPISTPNQPPRSNIERRLGQSARQAYQQRLESDPSFVPTVGEFWGHDDRLLDKNLRSLSGWWRGRWQGRGRGRGVDRMFMRGRGRGPVAGSDSGHRGSAEGDSDPQEAQKPPTEVPRVDQPWTHDGYEEMKKRDERRREAQQQQAPRGAQGFGPRGRGASITPRGRGGLARGGGFTSSPTRPAFVPPVSTPDRTWYAMKPERVWTKQHDAFLYFDFALKPRAGVGPGYRVKLPNAQAHIVRGPVRRSHPSTAEVASSSQAPPSEDGDKLFVVRLPKRSGKEKAKESTLPPSEPLTTVEELPIDDAFVVRPELAPPRILIVDTKSPAISTPETSLPSGPSHSLPQPIPPPAPASTEVVKASSQPAVVDPQPSQSAAPSADAAPSALQDSEVSPSREKSQTTETQEAPVRRNVPPVPPPLQTVFPPPQPSPPYSSHYSYASPLPPGVAVNQHGMAYEVATGRPVYLPPVYTPRPLSHGMMTPPGMSYMPGHMHHHSSSPDFLAPPHTPPIAGFVDPSTGGPLFTFPRQNARVEIRAPSSTLDLKSVKPQRRPSSLRTSAATYEPSQPEPLGNGMTPFPSSSPSDSYVIQSGLDALDSTNTGTPPGQQPADPAMLGYSAYPAPYYYPEQYGYTQYYDVSHVPQYEMYHADPHHPSQGVVYY